VRFSEPVTPAGAGISVIAPSGRQAGRGAARANGNHLSVAVSASDQGTYLVLWQVVSEDTHPARGQFTFSVGRRGPPSAGEDLGADVGNVPPAGLLLQALARWLHFCGLALAVGTVAFRVLVRPAAGEAKLDRLFLAGVIVLAAAEPVALAGQAVSLGQAPQEVAASDFGRILGLRLGGALLLWAAAGAVRQEGRDRPLLLIVGAAIAFADGLAGHRITGLPAVAAFGLGAVHELAMAVWVGGLLALVAVQEGFARFRLVAVGCLLTLVATGALLALAHLKSPADLAGAAYGFVLSAKVVAVGALILIAWWGARRVEALALAGVLALAALLVSLPPPR
jgi:copper transport protein